MEVSIQTRKDLVWGLGYEKEFPILIGPYHVSMLPVVINIILQRFEIEFSQFGNSKIKQNLKNKILNFSSDNCYMLTPQGASEVGITGTGEVRKVNSEKCQQYFWINYKNLSINRFRYFNDKWIGHILMSNRFVRSVDMEEIKSCRDYFVCWNKFIGELSTYKGILFRYIGSQVIKQLLVVSDYSDNFFPNIAHLSDSPTITLVKGRIFHHIRNQFTREWNTSPSSSKLHEVEVDVDNDCDYDKQTIQQAHLIFEKRSLIYNYPQPDADEGGYELRTFSEKGETFMNKTPLECQKNLSIQEHDLYNSLASVLSPWEIDNKVGVHFESQFASYYKPMLSFIHDGTSAIEVQQIYSGETELNITLPYIPHHKINPSNVGFLIPNNLISQQKLLDVNESADEYEKSFKLRHTYVMKTLQLLSPLIWASLTGVVYFSFGDNATIPETSHRFNSYSNYRVLTGQNIDQIYTRYHPYYSNEMNADISHILYKANIHPSGKNAFEFSVNRNDIKYSPDEDKYFGFEWKVLDQYPSEYMPHISLLVVMISQWLHNKQLNIWIFNDKISIPEIIETHVENRISWFESILFQGWNSYVDTDYANLLIQHLNLQEFKLPTHTCYDFLNGIYYNLFRHFKTQKPNAIWIIHCFFPDFYELGDEFANLPNINRINYDKMMDDFQYYFPDEFFNRVLQVGKIPGNAHDPYDEDYEDMELWENPQ